MSPSKYTRGNSRARSVPPSRLRQSGPSPYSGLARVGRRGRGRSLERSIRIQREYLDDEDVDLENVEKKLAKEVNMFKPRGPETCVTTDYERKPRKRSASVSAYRAKNSSGKHPYADTSKPNGISQAKARELMLLENRHKNQMKNMERRYTKHSGGGSYQTDGLTIEQRRNRTRGRERCRAKLRETEESQLKEGDSQWKPVR